MSYGYSAIDLSKYVITKCVENGCPVDNLQLQKILYDIQKDFLRRESVAFFDEIQAWQFGSVIPSVYYRFCGAGAMPITMRYQHASEIVDYEDRKYIDPIIDYDRKIKSWQMMSDVQKSDGPWRSVYDNGSGLMNTISLDCIRQDIER